MPILIQTIVGVHKEPLILVQFALFVAIDTD
ncbi:hypothetical protein JOD43_002319 [Pullulanibacillus pueri]|nr:hypothetical protein [Pullulanibacillus pueri]